MIAYYCNDTLSSCLQFITKHIFDITVCIEIALNSEFTYYSQHQWQSTALSSGFSNLDGFKEVQKVCGSMKWWGLPSRGCEIKSEFAQLGCPPPSLHSPPHLLKHTQTPFQPPLHPKLKCCLNKVSDLPNTSPDTLSPHCQAMCLTKQS